MGGTVSKDIIAKDRAGIQRLVAKGSDVPDGWEVIRDADPSPVVAPNLEGPGARGNVDAAGGAQAADLAL